MAQPVLRAQGSESRAMSRRSQLRQSSKVSSSSALKSESSMAVVSAPSSWFCTFSASLEGLSVV
eukprot:9523862-Alexandrium_andersonii.AAC.1